MSHPATVTRLRSPRRPSLDERVDAGVAAFNDAMSQLDTSLSRIVDATEANVASAREALRAGRRAFRDEWRRQQRRRGRPPLQAV